MDSVVRSYLDDLVAAARGVLRPNLIGAYAAGSIGLDAFQPGRSDVDLALVVADTVPDGRKRALVAALRHENLPCPARGLELVVYRSAVARSSTAEPGFEVELNSGPRMDFRQTYSPDDRPVADGHFWYALDRSILHQSGVALFGPPAAEAFADVTPAELHKLLIDALSWWIALPTPPGDEPAPGAEDAVLGACRSLAKHRHGHWLSKSAAGHRIASDLSAPPAATPAAPAPAAAPAAAAPASVAVAPASVAAARAVGVIRKAIAARGGGVPPFGGEARRFQRWVLAEIRHRAASTSR
ncbi:nucleotidyltransferase domain-containing protein [Cryptosporangium sp. NPDC048952]|uniref:nucleotidyltransferase domain-containing protein n=1 Tax=Cryptosporangium sp. NPDC048952 TaxID=3363961 RepID=UPI003711E03D